MEKSGAVALVPVPESGTWWGEPLALSAIVICAEREPENAGVKTTEIEQLAAGAMVLLQAFVCAKSKALAPETAMLAMVNGLLPVLPNTTSEAALACPTD
jgi:hypothetical protein